MKLVRSLSAMLVSALAVMIAQPSFAAQDKRSAGYKTPTSEEVRFLHLYAGCLIEASPRQVRRALGLDYRTKIYSQALRTAVSGAPKCKPNSDEGRISPLLLAGALAEGVMKSEPQTLQRLSIDPANPLQARDEGELTALCTVQAAPSEVRTLFESEPAGDAEKTALSAVMPHLSSCLKAGADARFNKIGLRAILATAAYRISQHNAAATQPNGS